MGEPAVVDTEAGQQPRGAHQDGAAAQCGEGLVPPQVVDGPAQSALVGVDGGGAPGEPGQVPAAALDGHVVEDHEPGQVDLGRARASPSRIEHGRYPHVVAHEHVPELDVAPQQRGGRLGVGQLGPTPRHARRRTPAVRSPRPPTPGTGPSARPRRPDIRPRRPASTGACRQDVAAAQGGPVETVDPGQHVDDLAVQLGLALGRGLGQPPRAQVGLARPAPPAPATRGMTRKGAPTQRVVLLDGERVTTAGTPAPAKVRLEPPLHGEVVGREQALAVGGRRTTHDACSGLDRPAERPVELHEDRLARQSRGGPRQRGETDVAASGRHDRTHRVSPSCSASRSRGSEIPMRDTQTIVGSMTTVAELVLARAEDDHTGLRFEDESWTWRQVVAQCAARARMLECPAPGRGRSTSACSSRTCPSTSSSSAERRWPAPPSWASTPRDGGRSWRVTWPMPTASSSSPTPPRRPPRRPRHRGRAGPGPAVRRPRLPAGARRRERPGRTTTAHQRTAAPAAGHDPGHAVSPPLHVGVDRRRQGGARQPGPHGRARPMSWRRGRGSGPATSCTAPCPCSTATPSTPASSRPSPRGRARPAAAVHGLGIPPRRPALRRHLLQLRGPGPGVRAGHAGRARRRREHPPVRLRHGRLPARHLDLQAPLRLPDRRGLRVERGGHLHGAGPGHAPPGHGQAAAGHRRGDRRPRHGCECPPAVFDAEGRLCNASTAIGEIVSRDGVSRFEGYYANDEADAERTRNGWFWSGDLGYRDEEGYFYFAGRMADWLRSTVRTSPPPPWSGSWPASPAWSRRWCSPCPTPAPATRSWPRWSCRPRPLRCRCLRGLPGAPERPRDEVGAAFRAHRRLASPSPARARSTNDRCGANAGPRPIPVWWRPFAAKGDGTSTVYRRMTPSDVAALDADFAEHGRQALLDM